MTPRLLDLFCGAGGATRGYQRAGFYVVGVDVLPQPNYCGDEFVQADALALLWGFSGSYARAWVEGRLGGPVDAIHASPPCQWGTAYARRPGHVRPSPNLVGDVRALLQQARLPWIIEQPPHGRSCMVAPVQCCGSSFGLDVRRHRLFESSVSLSAAPCDHAWQAPRFAPATNRTNPRRTVEVGVWRIPLAVQSRAMDVDWMTRAELSQAIPPAYTEHIGRQLLAALGREAAA